MRKNNSLEKDIEAITAFIQKQVEGVGIEPLLRKFKKYNERTLQRRLETLKKRGDITTTGLGKNLRYLSATKISRQIQIDKADESKRIEAYVTQPLHKRNPVGYNVDFLYDYIPNVTFYLPENLRNDFKKIGTIPDAANIGETTQGDIYSRLLIDLSWASSKLEGNTYSLLETEKLIKLGEVTRGKNKQETQMILNHKNAIETIIKYKDSLSFTSYSILNLHGMLSEGLMPDPNDEGRLRQKIIGIGGSTYIPLSIPQKVLECFNLILEKAEQIRDPFEQSFFIMVHIPYLQPFTDVNKRMSRIMLNIPFIKNGLSPVSFRDVPKMDYLYATLGVYELNKVDLLRDVFTWGYGRSTYLYLAIKQELVPPDPFLRKYRDKIYASVRAFVRTETVGINIPPEDLQQFNEVVKQQIALLHEGNLMRVGLTLEDFHNWQNKSETSKPENNPGPHQR